MAYLSAFVYVYVLPTLKSKTENKYYGEILPEVHVI